MEAPLRPKIVPVIMSGGSGTRLWPLSTEQTPKQFHALGSDRTLFQETLDRVSSGPEVKFLPPIVICQDRHAELVRRQLDEAGIAATAIVLEPFGRNTAAVAAVAAELAAERAPDALALLLPSDHLVAAPSTFRQAIARGAPSARTHILTFGVTPTRPETGYGYVQCGEPLMDGVFKAARFTEKPELDRAQAYLEEGGYLWNGGIFLFSPGVMSREMRLFRADIVEAAAAALASAKREGPFLWLDRAAFAHCPSESLDYAVMEHTEWSAVTPLDAGWADIGSWAELWRLSPHDEAGNALRGPALALETEGSLVWASPGRTVATLGVEDLIVVASDEAVIVLPKSRAQDLKMIVARMKQS
jgi:mannose-1-phosphate guanylyltransferase/mannose-6-phosphate isomerase